MDKILNWLRQDRRYITLIKSGLLAVLPVLCCMVYCAAQGKTIGQVYLPGSEWNDELFYFKQVEGIVNYGFPQGYFGFNESHALKLSFAAWSPVLVFPWILWGLLFGWNLMSPILCNIALMTICCFLFGWLVKPAWRQLGVLALLFVLYTPFVRYMLSGMPEVICFSSLILFYGLAINYLNRDKTWKLILLFLLSGVMTLMRPYLMLFLLLPVFFWVKKSRLKGAVGSALVLGLVLGLYACIKYYLGAAYFDPLFFTDWVEAFFDRGLFGGIHFTLGKLYYMGLNFMRHTIQGFRSGLASGAFFGGYLVMMGILLFQSIRDFVVFRRLRKADVSVEASKRDDSLYLKELGKRLVIEVHMALCFVAMLFALLLMYKLTEGSKHLLTFMAAGIFVIALMETRFLKKAVLMGVIFAYLYSYMAVDPYDYQVPFVTEERSSQVQAWKGAFSQNMQLVKKDVPNYGNDVLWAFSDVTENGSVNTAWQLLYGLPEGFGISCCKVDYVLQNIASLKCRYLVSPAGGEIDSLCREAGYREIWGDETMVLYQLY